MIDYTGKIANVINQIFNLDKDTVYDISIKVHKKKRSKNANSYCWALCTEIANVMRKSKEEIYLDMLKSYGQSLLIPVEKGNKPNGYFKYYSYETSSIINGKEADWYKVYKGSSEYDTREMAILLDGIIQEATQLEIPTITEKELEQMKGSWNNV